MAIFSIHFSWKIADFSVVFGQEQRTLISQMLLMMRRIESERERERAMNGLGLVTAAGFLLPPAQAVEAMPSKGENVCNLNTNKLKSTDKSYHDPF